MFPFNNLKVEIYGESHSECIGMRLYGIPLNSELNEKEIQDYVDRRKSGLNAWSTARKEADIVHFISGIENGIVTKPVIEAVVYNTNVKKSDYQNVQHIPRPSHADYVSAVKDKTTSITSGGGRFSARLTVALCISGAICDQLLKKRGIFIASYISQIGKIEGDSYKNSNVDFQRIKDINTNLKALSNAEEMEKEVVLAKAEGDSVGGRVDVMIFGMPMCYGDNLFNGLEGKISAFVFSVPAVKGIEFGLGFGFASQRASRVNDEFFFDGEKIITLSNNNGGINGGISNGMPITFSVAFKPTPSISKEQKSVNLETLENVTLKIQGRHDSCIVPRGAIVVEAVTALAVLDVILDANN